MATRAPAGVHAEAPRGAGRAATLRSVALLLGVLALVTLVYAPTLNDWFGGDDFLVIGPVKAMGPWEGVWRAFLMRDNIVYWRPLVSPLYALDVYGFGLQPLGYHLVVLALHLTNVTLLALVARALTGRWGVALAAAALFGVHAAHTTTVAQISSTVELFSVVWYLAAVLCAVRWATRTNPSPSPSPARRGESSRPPFPVGKGVRGLGFNRWYLLSLVAFVLALLTKESTASAAGVLTVLFAFYVAWPRWQQTGYARTALGALVRAAAPFWLVVLPYIVLVYITDTADESGIVRQMYRPGPHIGQNLWWLLARLAAPLKTGRGPTVSVAGHLGAALLLLGGALIAWRGSRSARFLALWTLIALTPLTLWRPDLLLGRFTYQAAAPFAVLLALAGAWLVERLGAARPRLRQPAGGALTLAAALLLGLLTIDQNRERTREGEDYRLLVTALQREAPTAPPGGAITLLGGPWSGPFHALYLAAVADTLYGPGAVRLTQTDAETEAQENGALRLRFDGETLRRAP